jgi:parallel beta-helix repeat protein
MGKIGLLKVRAAILAFAAVQVCGARTFYVANVGNDRNGGTRSEPWATLQHAVDTIAPGDTILVRAGTYSGCRISDSGRQRARKILKAIPGERVLINTPGAANTHRSAIEVEGPAGTIVTDWTIEGFEVADAPLYGIDLRVTDRIVVRRNLVHGSGMTGIFTSFANHVLIEDNESHHNGEHGIYQSNSSKYPVIRRNSAHHNAAAGIHINGDLNFGPPGLVEFARVEYNDIRENGAVRGGSGINCDGAMNSVFRYNILINNHASGISLYAIDASRSSSNNRVEHNTIVMAPGARWALNIPDDGKSAAPTGNEVRFNALCTPDKDKGSILTWKGHVEGFVSDHNVVVDRFSADNGASVIGLDRWQALGFEKHSKAGCEAVMKRAAPGS